MDPKHESSSQLHKASRSPSKRSKTKSKVWNKVVRMTHKSKSSSSNDVHSGIDGAATGEIGGAACLPSENMDVDDIPSTNSSSTSRQFSDWGSSSESLYVGFPREESHVRCVTCNTGTVVFQPCVKPSLVRSVFGPCVNSNDKQRKGSGKKSKSRTTKRKSQYSYDEDGCIEEWFNGSIQNSSNQDECHCPSCCNCQSNFKSQIYKSWPRKYECPLKTFARGRNSVAFSKHSTTSSSDEDCLHRVLSKGEISRTMMTSKVWGHHTGQCRILSKVTQSCCCAQQVEYERKSRSLPTGASLDLSFLRKCPDEFIVHTDMSSACEVEMKLPCCNNKGAAQHNLGVDGAVYKKRMEVVLNWFHDFSDQQKNSMIKKLLEQCDLPQMHMLSVTMEPILHKHCPHNCQDLLSWLPKRLSNLILSYLDPVSLCRCSLVSKSWFEMANEPTLWKQFCLHPTWRLSKEEEQKQLINHMTSYVHWKQVFAERYRLCRNWLRGLCTVRTFEGHTQGISCVQFDDTRIVSGSSDKTIKVWNIRTNSPWSVQTLTGHSGTVRCLHLEGNMLVSGSTDRTIKVWDLSTQSSWSSIACRVTMIGHMDTVRCLQVDDDKVVSGSYDMTLKVWDIKTGRCRFTLRGHTRAVLCLQFDSVKIISGSADNTIKIWSLKDEVCLTTLTGHQDAVTCLQFDANKIISGSLDRNLKYWDLHSGKCTSTIDWAHAEGHTGVVRCLQADSWRVVSASDDRTIKVWNFETGERLVTLQHHTDGVTCLQFNSSKIVSGSYDKTVKLWDFGSV